MNEEVKSLIDQLSDADWIKRGKAIRQLAPVCEHAIAAVPRLFELIFDDKAPIRSDAEALIKKMATAAIPFLLSQVRSEDVLRRVNALELLTETGGQRRTWYKLAKQVLEARSNPLPDWGDYADDVRAAFTNCLEDDDLLVRFAAAAALEEFGMSVSETIPVFIEVLQHGEVYHKNLAALSLGRIGPPASEALSTLRELTNSPDQKASLAARNAIDRISGGPNRE